MRACARALLPVPPTPAGVRRLLLAVSGGADSVAMARALAGRAAGGRLRLAVVHVNHGLRGRAADADERFVVRLARRLGLPAFVERADVASRARKERVSIEMAARAERRDALRRVAAAWGADAVALAHTADDQAETVLLRMARGTTPRGLGAMRADTREGGLRIWRPLLGAPRAEVVRFLRARREAWREDASNRDPRFLRNRVRREVLPLVERRLNPRVREALARLASFAREDDDLLLVLARRRLAACARTGGGLSAARLRLAPPPLRRRALVEWLLSSGLPAEAVDADTVAQVSRLLDRPGRRTLAGGRIVECRRGLLRLAAARRGDARAPWALPLPVPGVVSPPGLGWRLGAEWARGYGRPSSPPAGRAWPAEAWLRRDRCEGRPAVVRAWRAGDCIRLHGMGGARKLQDLFTDRKIPRADRGRVPVLEIGGEIAWVAGARIAEGWQVPSARAPSLLIRVRRAR